MAEAINEAELGRNKKGSSPAEHLQHLLGLGWDCQSPLIQKYVLKNRLQAELSRWEASMAESAKFAHPDKSEKTAKLKNRKPADR